MRSQAILLIAFGIGLGGCALPKESVREKSVESSSAQGLGFSWASGVFVWIDTDTRQKFELTDFRDLVVIDERLNNATREWESIRHTSSASFHMMRTASAHDDVFCFAGFAANGDFVLQRWLLFPQEADVAGSSEPLVNRDGLVPKSFRKTDIFRGTLCEGVVALEFDLEERFMLALTRTGSDYRLYRFENRPGATPNLVLESSSTPELADMRFLQKLQHGVLGRVWMLSSDIGMTSRIVLVDAYNDGAFDGAPLIGGSAYFASIGFDDYTQWDPLLGP